MSRTNHYRICEDCTPEQACEWHQPPSRYRHKPLRFIPGRRPWTRRRRWPSYTAKSWINPPTADWWQDQKQSARRKQKQEFLRNPEDPMITPMKQLIDLWDWY